MCGVFEKKEMWTSENLKETPPPKKMNMILPLNWSSTPVKFKNKDLHVQNSFIETLSWINLFESGHKLIQTLTPCTNHVFSAEMCKNMSSHGKNEIWNMESWSVPLIQNSCSNSNRGVINMALLSFKNYYHVTCSSKLMTHFIFFFSEINIHNLFANCFRKPPSISH